MNHLQTYISEFQQFLSGTQKENMTEYYVFFLEQELTFELMNENANINQILFLFNAFEDIAKNIYSKNIDYKRTGIFIFDRLTEDITTFMRSYFFDSDRDERELLVRKS